MEWSLISDIHCNDMACGQMMREPLTGTGSGSSSGTGCTATRGALVACSTRRIETITSSSYNVDRVCIITSAFARDRVERRVPSPASGPFVSSTIARRRMMSGNTAAQSDGFLVRRQINATTSSVLPNPICAFDHHTMNDKRTSRNEINTASPHPLKCLPAAEVWK